ncbi:MAG: hypothetical protein K2L74_04815, partial [Muribaculaceae bacterium]|nr:hypothetical protein [Muribaculaceae bacterium]
MKKRVLLMALAAVAAIAAHATKVRKIVTTDAAPWVESSLRTSARAEGGAVPLKFDASAPGVELRAWGTT